MGHDITVDKAADEDDEDDEANSLVDTPDQIRTDCVLTAVTKVISCLAISAPQIYLCHAFKWR